MVHAPRLLNDMRLRAHVPKCKAEASFGSSHFLYGTNGHTEGARCLGRLLWLITLPGQSHTLHIKTCHPTLIASPHPNRYSKRMRKLIAIALARRLGQTLTPEVALGIARELCGQIDATIDVQQFTPLTCGKYRIQCELLRDILPELHVLHELHYQETEQYRANIKLDPDYDSLLDRESRGRLLQFTARVAATGELAGNLRVYLSHSMHTRTPICTEDTFYVLPQHRGGFMAVRLWQFAERCCQALGVREFYIDFKTINQAASMARYLGYQQVATKFAKVI